MDPFTPATDLAGAVRRREVSPVELAEVYLGRIDKLDGELNAFCFRDDDRVLAWARDAEAAASRAADGELPPFHGVPLPIKDLNRVEGWPTTYGSRGASTAPNTSTDFVVQRFMEAGFIPLGMTNSPEFGTVSYTESEAHGVTRNPWDLERTPGGSSGGEAAAITAGCSPCGVGTDSGASVRLPAHFCGLASIKPTSGLVPVTGVIDDLGQIGALGDPRTQVGPLARTVADVALLLGVLGGPDGRDGGAPPVPLGDPAAVSLRGLRGRHSGERPRLPHRRDGGDGLARR
jgi:amidase